MANGFFNIVLGADNHLSSGIIDPCDIPIPSIETNETDSVDSGNQHHAESTHHTQQPGVNGTTPEMTAQSTHHVQSSWVDPTSLPVMSTTNDRTSNQHVTSTRGNHDMSIRSMLHSPTIEHPPSHDGRRRHQQERVAAPWPLRSLQRVSGQYKYEPRDELENAASAGTTYDYEAFAQRRRENCPRLKHAPQDILDYQAHLVQQEAMRGLASGTTERKVGEDVNGAEERDHEEEVKSWDAYEVGSYSDLMQGRF